MFELFSFFYLNILFIWLFLFEPFYYKISGIRQKYYITAAVADDQDWLSIVAYAFCVDLGNIETDVRFVTVFCDYVVNSAGTITTFEARMGYDT